MKKLLIAISFLGLSLFAKNSSANITDQYYCWNNFGGCQFVTWYDCYNPYNGFYSPRCTYYWVPAYAGACYSTGAISCFYR